MKAQVCSSVVTVLPLMKVQPLPDCGLRHRPKLNEIHRGSADLEHAVLILAFASLLAVAEDDDFVLRDEELEGLSMRGCSDRELAACSVCAQFSGDSVQRWVWMRLTSVKSSMTDLMGSNWVTLRFIATIKSATARKAG